MTIVPTISTLEFACDNQQRQSTAQHHASLSHLQLGASVHIQHRTRPSPSWIRAIEFFQNTHTHTRETEEFTAARQLGSLLFEYGLT